MPINDITTHQTGDTLTICVPGAFKFALHQKFRLSYQNHLLKIKHIVVDLTRVELIDSAALGMLMVLYKEAMAKNANITLTLTNPSSQVRTLLQVANFQEVFVIR